MQLRVERRGIYVSVHDNTYIDAARSREKRYMYLYMIRRTQMQLGVEGRGICICTVHDNTYIDVARRREKGQMYLYIVKMITEPGTTNPTIAWVEGIPKHRTF